MTEQFDPHQPRWNADVAARLTECSFFIQRREVRAGTSFHRQPGIEVQIIDEGQGQLYLEEQWIDFRARDVLIFQGEAAHESRVTSGASYQRTVICLDDARLGAVGREVGMPLFDVVWLRDRPVHHLRLGLAAHQELTHLCEQMDHEVLLTRRGWHGVALALLTQLIARLQRWAEAQVTLGAMPGLEDASDLVQLGCAYVEQHIEDDLSLARVSEALGVSEAHLTRSFRLHIGVPFYQYVLAQRIRQACRLLHEHPDLSVTQVAMQLAFRSPSSFSRAFRRIMGQSPAQFRRRGRLDT